MDAAYIKRVIAKAVVPGPVSRQLRQTPIFQIGFNKCGTTSLAGFLVAAGIATVHWDEGRAARNMMRRIQQNADPVADYPFHRAFTDLVHLDRTVLAEPYKHFDYLHRWYPAALFILNTRNRQSWIGSRLRHRARTVGEALHQRYSQVLGIHEDAVPEFWRWEWEHHHDKVRRFFAGNERFLEFDIDRDDQSMLCRFLVQHHPACADLKLQQLNRTAIGQGHNGLS